MSGRNGARSSARKRAIIAVAAVVAVVLTVTGAVAGWRAYSAKRTVVTVVPVSSLDRSADAEAMLFDEISGEVYQTADQKVYVDSAKTVSEVYVSKGQQVSTGDRLFAYDMTAEQLNLQLAQLQVDMARADLTAAQNRLAAWKKVTPVAATAQNQATQGAQGGDAQGAGESDAGAGDCECVCPLEPEPVPGPAVEPAVEPTGEPAVEPTGEPAVEPTGEPAEPEEPEPTEDSSDEPEPEPTAEESEEPGSEDYDAMREQIEAEVRAEVEEELRAEIEAELREQIEAEVWEQVTQENNAQSAQESDEGADDANNEAADIEDDSAGAGTQAQGYTAEELARLIRDAQRDVDSADLEVRRGELAAREAGAAVDDGVVYATTDGVVTSVGDPSNPPNDGSAFLTVSSDDGTVVKATMSEFTLATAKVGGSVTVTDYMSGSTYDATITSIDSVPVSASECSLTDGMAMACYSMMYGQKNVSWYNFYLSITGSATLSEDSYLSVMVNDSDEQSSLWIPDKYVRKDDNGYYVMKNNGGVLARQNVTVGAINEDLGIQILDGLTTDDSIAFPYGEGAAEGTRTKAGAASSSII